MDTYEDYRAMPMSLTFEEMSSLHRAIASETDGGSDAAGYYRDLLTAAVGYAQMRSRWPLWSREE